MPASVGNVHHVRLTVTDVQRSKAFYNDLLGLSVAAEDLPPQEDPNYWLMLYNLQGGVILSNGTVQLGLRPCDAPRRVQGDRFDPLRVGLDHVSFSVASTEELRAARDLCAERGYEHGEPTELPPFGISVLSVTDPDGIQLELTAPLT